ncbi:hypothetical protein BN1013_02137 [Candidatus Rubidus massiliensis]|nr:hypothetical protein BN1013_02137 [Candidatus Rubidus massiliensis]
MNISDLYKVKQIEKSFEQFIQLTQSALDTKQIKNTFIQLMKDWEIVYKDLSKQTFAAAANPPENENLNKLRSVLIKIFPILNAQKINFEELPLEAKGIYTAIENCQSDDFLRFLCFYKKHYCVPYDENNTKYIHNSEFLKLILTKLVKLKPRDIIGLLTLKDVYGKTVLNYVENVIVLKEILLDVLKNPFKYIENKDSKSPDAISYFYSELFNSDKMNQSPFESEGVLQILWPILETLPFESIYSILKLEKNCQNSLFYAGRNEKMFLDWFKKLESSQQLIAIDCLIRKHSNEIIPYLEVLSLEERKNCVIRSIKLLVPIIHNITNLEALKRLMSWFQDQEFFDLASIPVFGLTAYHSKSSEKFFVLTQFIDTKSKIECLFLESKKGYPIENFIYEENFFNYLLTLNSSYLIQLIEEILILPNKVSFIMKPLLEKFDFKSLMFLCEHFVDNPNLKYLIRSLPKHFWDAIEEKSHYEQLHLLPFVLAYDSFERFIPLFYKIPFINCIEILKLTISKQPEVLKAAAINTHFWKWLENLPLPQQKDLLCLQDSMQSTLAHYNISKGLSSFERLTTLLSYDFLLLQNEKGEALITLCNQFDKLNLWLSCMNQEQRLRFFNSYNLHFSILTRVEIFKASEPFIKKLSLFDQVQISNKIPLRCDFAADWKKILYDTIAKKLKKPNEFFSNYSLDKIKQILSFSRTDGETLLQTAFIKYDSFRLWFEKFLIDKSLLLQSILIKNLLFSPSKIIYDEDWNRLEQIQSKKNSLNLPKIIKIHEIQDWEPNRSFLKFKDLDALEQYISLNKTDHILSLEIEDDIDTKKLVQILKSCPNLQEVSLNFLFPDKQFSNICQIIKLKRLAMRLPEDLDLTNLPSTIDTLTLSDVKHTSKIPFLRNIKHLEISLSNTSQKEINLPKDLEELTIEIEDLKYVYKDLHRIKKINLLINQTNIEEELKFIPTDLEELVLIFPYSMKDYKILVNLTICNSIKKLKIVNLYKKYSDIFPKKVILPEFVHSLDISLSHCEVSFLITDVSALKEIIKN